MFGGQHLVDVSTSQEYFRHEEATSVVDSARALLEELPEEPLLSVDAAWSLVREDSWDGQQRSEIVMGLVTSLRVAYGHCATQVF